MTDDPRTLVYASLAMIRSERAWQRPPKPTAPRIRRSGKAVLAAIQKTRLR